MGEGGDNGGYNPGTVVLGRMVMVSELQFPYNSFTSTPASKTASADRGMIALDDDNLYYRTASEWKKAPLQDFDYSAPSAPILSSWSTLHAASGHQLSNNSHIIVAGNGSNSQSAQTHSFILPLVGEVGMTIQVMALSHVKFSLHSSVAGSTLYIATISDVYNSSSKEIKFTSGTHRSGTIRYVPDYSGGKTRWISDNGIIV